MHTTSSKFALLVNVFLPCTSFSIVLPSLWPYLQTLGLTPGHLALIIALYSIGEALGALLFGAVTALPHRTHTNTMLLCTSIGILGSISYISAPPLHAAVSGQGWWGWTAGGVAVAVGRFLQGVWTGGAQAIQQCYLADCLTGKQLTRMIVLINAVACLGFVTGPVFGMLVSYLPGWEVAGWRFDDTVAPGYFVLMSGFACICVLKWGLRERDDGLGREELELIEREDEGGKGGWVEWSMCNVIMFVHFMGFALQETVTT